MKFNAQLYAQITHSAYFHCANVAHSTQAPGTSANTALLAIFLIARNAPLPHPWRTVAAVSAATNEGDPHHPDGYRTHFGHASVNVMASFA